jgi:SOS-response transcriptional repressor LexA
MNDLTSSQDKIWRFLQDYYHKHGYKPSSATISQRFGFASNNSAVEYVAALARKGYSLPDSASLPRNGNAMAEVKAWRKAYRGHHFDGKQIVKSRGAKCVDS